MAQRRFAGSDEVGRWGVGWTLVVVGSKEEEPTALPDLPAGHAVM